MKRLGGYLDATAECSVEAFQDVARLNWQLACQFFSANNISYRIVVCSVAVVADAEPGRTN